MKRFSLIIIPVTIILLGWLVIRTLPPKEPSYKGRTLSQWLLPYSIDLEGGEWTGPEQKKHFEEATEAIHAIGTNAIPTLLIWLQAKDSPVKLKLASLADRQSLIQFRYIDAQTRHAMAAHGFLRLGKDAEFAVPALIQLAENPASGCSDWAADCLILIDPKAGNKVISDREAQRRKRSREAKTNAPVAK